MEAIEAKDLMIPTRDYPTVSHKISLKEALETLQEAQLRFGETGMVAPRAVWYMTIEKRLLAN